MHKSAVTSLAAFALSLAAVVPAPAQQSGTQPPPAGAEATAPISLTRDQIMQLQQALNDNGFDAGEVDGVLGLKTSQALQRFQSKAGLKPTGHIDQQTLALVGMTGSAPQAPSGANPTSGQGSSAQPGNPGQQTPVAPKQD